MNELRLLLIGDDAPNSLARSFKRAFENLGASVVHYCDRQAIERALPGAGMRGLRRYLQPLAVPTFNRNLRHALGRQTADLVLVIKGQHILPETVAFLRDAVGAPVVNYYPDDPFCARHTNRIGARSVFAEYDVCFTFQRHRIPDYHAAGARRVEYLPFARDPELHYPLPDAGPAPYDVTFIGSLDRERVEWLEPLARFRVALYGGGTAASVPSRSPLARAAFLPAVFGSDLPRAFASGAISVNILRWGNYDAHNMRSFEAPACGAFTLTSRSRELAELFREGEEVVFFDDRDDLAQKVKYYLDRPEERARIARNALRRVENETYEARARAILEAVRNPVRPGPACPPPLASPPVPARFRLAVFTSHPIQYQAPLFRAMARRPELAPTVFFGSRHGLEPAFDPGFGRSIAWDIPLLEGYDYVFLENCSRQPNVSRFLGVSVPTIGAALGHGRFDAVLVLGWNTMGHAQAIASTLRQGLPLILRGESNLGPRPSNGLRRALRAAVWLPARRLLYGQLLRRAAAVLAIGSRNAEYYRYFGVPAERIHLAPYCVDNERFSLPAAAREGARWRLRDRLRFGSDDVVFVSAAKLIEKKRPLDLLHAFSRMARQIPAARVLFLGDGPERARVEERARELGIQDRIRISGFINQTEMPEWFAVADCLVLPSDARETWGLVVNEAMAAGLPVIASDAVGCVPDLVRPGENGAVYPVGDVTALSSALAELATLPLDSRRELGQRSAEIIASVTFDRVVDALLAALEGVTVPAAGVHGTVPPGSLVRAGAVTSP